MKDIVSIFKKAIFSNIIDYLIDLNNDENKELYSKLNENYISYFKENYEYLTFLEKFNLDALNEFLLEHLKDKVSSCFIADTVKERAFLKNSLLENSYIVAEADSIGKQQCVYAYVDSFLNIYESFLNSKVKDVDKYIINKQTDELASIIKSEQEEFKKFIEYHGSFAEFVDSIETFNITKIDFHYLNPKIGFVRRDEQFGYLNNFLEDDKQVSSLVITGPGGIGKSKLLHQYIKEKLYDIKWKAIMLDRNLIDDLCKYTDYSYPKNLLIVIDYAAEKSKIIGKWIRKIVRFKTDYKIRIVMIERQGLTKDNEMVSYPFWYQQLIEHSGYVLNEIQYQHGDGFYELPPFKKEEIFQIMDMLPREKGPLSENEKENIYKKIISFSNGLIDKRFNTPLIALLLTGAYIEGKDIPNPEDLMIYVINRNKKSIKRFLQIGDNENEKRVLDSLECLMVYATAVGGFNLDTNLPALLDFQRQNLYDYLDVSVLKSLLNYINGNRKKYNYIEPLKPDIIGEYFVLEYIFRKYKSKKNNKIVEACWGQSEEFLSFLIRCAHSYLENFPELIFGNQQVLFQGANAIEKTIILFEITTISNTNFIKKAIDIIGDLYKEHKEYSIAILFAMGLVNLSIKQKECETKETVDKIKEITDQHPNNAEIAVRYAKGLVNLSIKQKECEVKKTVDKIKEITDQYPNNAEIALQYAKGLVNLSIKQKEYKVKKTVDRIKEITYQYPNNAEIATVYASGLVNLSIKQKECEAKKTVDRIKEITDQYPNNAKIVLEYAKGLVNLSLKQEECEVKKTVDKIKEITDQYPNNAEIALQYAKGLVNLSLKQEECKVKKTVDRIKEITYQYPNNAEIAAVYASGLVNLSSIQEECEAKETVDRIKEITYQYPNNAEIALEYAFGLCNLSFLQEECEAKETVDRIKEITYQYPNNAKIAVVYASGLANLSNKQEKYKLEKQ